LPEGGFTRYLADGSSEQMSIYDAAIRYIAADIPLVVLAGREYGSGSSRDWAAKGTSLLGVRAVIAQSFERIHRSNLVGMGVLPLQFPDGESARVTRPDRGETFSVNRARRGDGRWRRPARGGQRPRRARRRGSGRVRRTRADRHAARGGVLPPRGILQYVLRALLAER